MVLLLVSSAVQSGISVVFMKLVMEIVEASAFLSNWLLVVFICSACALSMVYQMHFLNQAMKYYDQLEVIPIYQTAIMLMWIGAGMIILSEHRFYSQTQLVFIGLSTMLCLVGIKLLTSKKKKLHLRKISEASSCSVNNGP